MGGTWRLAADGPIRATVDHGFGTARTGQTKGRDTVLQRGVVSVLDHPGRMQRTGDVRTFPDQLGASSLTPQTDFPDDTGHCFPGGHAIFSFVLAE